MTSTQSSTPPAPPPPPPLPPPSPAAAPPASALGTNNTASPPLPVSSVLVLPPPDIDIVLKVSLAVVESEEREGNGQVNETPAPPPLKRSRSGTDDASDVQPNSRPPQSSVQYLNQPRLVQPPNQLPQVQFPQRPLSQIQNRPFQPEQNCPAPMAWNYTDTNILINSFRSYLQKRIPQSKWLSVGKLLDTMAIEEIEPDQLTQLSVSNARALSIPIGPFMRVKGYLEEWKKLFDGDTTALSYDHRRLPHISPNGPQTPLFSTSSAVVANPLEQRTPKPL
ncbi:hypothetical protein B7463_g2657, partial [Scytalidium lignicola]